MRINKKYISILILILVLSLTLAGCSSTSKVNKPQMEDGAVSIKITGSCYVEVDGNKVIVSSDADLMDSAIVVMSLTDKKAKILAEQQIVKFGDNLRAEFIIGEDWADEVIGFLVMTPDKSGKQSDAITLKYGKKFENVVTENPIFSDKEVMIVFQSELTKIK